MTGCFSVDVSYAIFACTVCKNCVHLDGPSISSRDLRRFLVLSTDVESYYTVGTRCSFPPVTSDFIFAPMAACSYFSIALIFSCILSRSSLLYVSTTICAPGYVDVSLS
jgi:hypothetical protein